VTILYWCNRQCWGEEERSDRQPFCKYCGNLMQPKNERDKLPEITLTLKLYPSDLGYIARMPTDEKGVVLSEALLEFFTGLTSGHAKREVEDGVEPYRDDPDYDAFADFCDQVEKIRNETPAMVLIAHSASE